MKDELPLGTFNPESSLKIEINAVREGGSDLYLVLATNSSFCSEYQCMTNFLLKRSKPILQACGILNRLYELTNL